MNIFPNKLIELTKIFDGKYVFEKTIYSNPNVSNVYLAHSAEDNKKYAIKEVNSNNQQELRTEIESLKKIQQAPHINVINLIEEKQHKNLQYFVFDYMEEGSLFDYIKSKKKITEDFCIDILKQFGKNLMNNLQINIVLTFKKLVGICTL